jgi:glycolate oxidase FAD binding subunit
VPVADEALLESWRERIAAATAAGRALRLRGTGSKDFYGEQLEGDVLDLCGFSGIVHYEPSELVLTARCGTKLSEIEATLAANDQFLAFEPPTFGADPTIGGVVAAGLSGPRRMYAGAARDFVLGARLLTARGELLRFGGEVMKNVAGFDVSRLLCGSLGILGILTEVSLKVLPRPRREETVRLELAAPEAVATFNRLAASPVPLSAAAWSKGSAWVRLSGAESAVRAAQARIGGERVAETEACGFWQALRDCRLPLFGATRLWRISVPSAADPLSLPAQPLIDWGGALRWYAVPADVEVRAEAQAAGGTALLWRGESPGARFHPLAAGVLALHRRLKAQFDPQGIFNPGRLVVGL